MPKKHLKYQNQTQDGQDCQRTFPAPGNQVIERESIHHACTMIADGAVGGVGYPLKNVTDGLGFQGGQAI